MDEITRLVLILCEKIGDLGLAKYLALPEDDKKDLNKLFTALNEFLES